MPTVGPYEISIVAGGRTLQEYDPPEGEEDAVQGTKVKYIEATEGLDFHIKVSVQPFTKFPTTFKQVEVYVDGHFVDSFSLDKESHGSGRKGWTRQRNGRSFLESGTWVRKPLRFTNLVTTEDAVNANDLKEIAKDIGHIQVQIYDATRELSSNHTEQSSNLSQSVPEKALKGQPIDMSVGYGFGRPTPQPRRYTVHRMGEKLASFTYKYRSRRALQLLELIATPLDPQPLEERDFDTLNPQELRELLIQIREQGSQTTNKIAKLKAEAVEIKEEGTPGVGTRRRRSTPIDNGEDDECMIVEVKKRKVTKKEVCVLDLT